MDSARATREPLTDPRALPHHMQDLLTVCLGYAQLIHRALAVPEINRDRLVMLSGKLSKYIAELDASMASQQVMFHRMLHRSSDE